MNHSEEELNKAKKTVLENLDKASMFMFFGALDKKVALGVTAGCDRCLSGILLAAAKLDASLADVLIRVGDELKKSKVQHFSNN